MTKKCVSVQTRGKRIFYVMNDQIYTCTQGYFSVIYVRTPKMQHKSISVTLSTWEWWILHLFFSLLAIVATCPLFRTEFLDLGDKHDLDQIICCGGCPVHCRIFSSIHGVYILAHPIAHPQLDNKLHLQTLLNVPGRQLYFQVWVFIFEFIKLVQK